MTLAYPSGRKRGAILEDRSPRSARLKVADRCNSIKDIAEVIDEHHWEDLRVSSWHQNKRYQFHYTMDQGRVGSCSAEAGSIAKHACDSRQGLPSVFYNPWSVYWKTSGGMDRGSVIGDNVEYIRDHGVCPEEAWPRSKGWKAEPGREAKRIAKMFRITEFFYIETPEELVSALLQGFNCHGGYSGHSICFMQYAGRRKLIYKNSWSEDWGDDGFGTLNLSDVRFAYGCYAYKTSIDWTTGDWAPNLCQADLSIAVTQYLTEAGASLSRWPQQKREEEYQLYVGTV